MPRILETKRVSRPGAFSSFGSYHVHPDSPDSSLVAYILWKKPPETLFGGDAELWICDPDFSHQRKVASLYDVMVHVGGGVAWVDNDRVQVFNVGGPDRYGAGVVNVRTGKIELGPFVGALTQHEPSLGRVLLSAPSLYNGKPFLGELPYGVHVLDCSNGSVTQVCKPTDFAGWRDRMNVAVEPAAWTMSHPTWSPDGERIAAVLEPDEPGAGWWNYIFTMYPDGSGKRFFGTKPIHWEWYDNHSIWGNDANIPGLPNDRKVGRWLDDGLYMANLAGEANHNAMSPDKRYIAGESWYDSDPVVLWLYRAGENKPCATVMEHPYPQVTWGLSAHVDPSFSRDGRRLYYNKAVDGRLNECWCAFLSED